MTDLEAYAIVAYLRSLPAVRMVIAESTCEPPPDLSPIADLSVVVNPDLSPAPPDLGTPDSAVASDRPNRVRHSTLPTRPFRSDPACHTSRSQASHV